MNPGSGRAGRDDRDQPNRPQADDVGLGAALRRALVGYRRRLDKELAAAGFDDRRFPDGRVLRICSPSDEATISQIGRELGITRQGASKIVASLRDRRYLTLTSSPTDGREKVVTLTPRAIAYLAAHRRAVQALERQLRAEVGTEGFDSLHLLLDALGAGEQPRLSDYLRQVTNVDGLRYLQE